MKKIKIMILTILVLAIVGGTLAFKSSKKFGSNFCTASSPGPCTSYAVGSMETPSGGTAFYATYTFITINCTKPEWAPDCIFQLRLENQ